MDYVYWIYDESCKDMAQDGYIGVTKDPKKRLEAHKAKNPRIPKDAQMEIIYSGTRQECFELEENLRPQPKIGWNSAMGGKHGWKTGFGHSDKTKEKLKRAWTDERKEKASIWKAEQNRKLKGQKRPKQSESVSGTKNPMHGKTHSEKARKKISEAHRGKTPHNKQEIYCIHCQQRVSKTILKKYHGFGKKACVRKTLQFS